MTPIEPLQFSPIFRSYLWGGDQLKKRLNKEVPGPGIWAESWEIVDHGKDQSIVCAGPWQGQALGELVTKFPLEILGAHASETNRSFPLLLKYLDCNSVLSVQVHPNDDYAQRMDKPDLGKTEAWYIVEAQPGAVLYAGLKPTVSKIDLQEAIRSGNTEECLHQITPKAGDCVFIPAGTVHALGSGLIVAEIQQASDTTFRLFDWNRVDAEGKSRPLHIEQALEVIDFDRGPIEPTQNLAEASQETTLVQCDKFRLIRLTAGTHDVATSGSFAIVTVPQGSAEITTANGQFKLELGQSALLPAALKKASIEVQPGSTVLLAQLPL